MLTRSDKKLATCPALALRPHTHIVMDITLAELEQAINYWRSARPSTGEERALSPEVNALANVYALMIFSHARTISLESLEPAAQQLLETWRQSPR
jgi:hypothetical protein